MVDIHKTTYKASAFWNYYARSLGEINGTTTMDHSRVIHTGTFKVCLRIEGNDPDMPKGKDWGDEIQFSIFSSKADKKVKFEASNGGAWNTIDINLPVSEIDNLIEALQQFKVIYEKNCKEVKAKKWKMN